MFSGSLTNTLVASETKHKGIRVRRSLGTIHDKELLQGVFELTSQFKDTSLQLAVWQRFVFIEQRHDKDRYNRHHKDGKDKHETPNINVKVFATHLLERIEKE